MRRLRSASLRRFGADDRATAAIEIGLIALPLVMLLLGLVEFGRGLHVKTAMNEAVDRGQRVLLIDPEATAEEVAAEIRRGFRAGDADLLTVDLGDEAVAGETYRRISLAYPMRLLIPSPVGRSVTIAAEHLVFTR